MPYSWQCRLACGEKGNENDGTPCSSRLIDIPTGLGKTAGVTLAWLWNQQRGSQYSNSKSQISGTAEPWPRRLVYCLPMRTLVEQTADEVKKWLGNLESKGLLGPKRPRVVILMGGEDPEDKDWDLYPEDPAILIGTQDMLLSRALNRGYGMSRYRWPMHFALLNNDCLWVMDEVQLMGSGLWTSAQLDWMRECRFKPQFPVKTWWMSATIGGDFLATSDRIAENMASPDTLTLEQSEIQSLSVLQACRPVKELKLKTPPKKTTNKKIKSASKASSVFEQISSDVAAKHVSGTLSLIVCNRVAIAQNVHHALSKEASLQNVPIKLLSSRFRSMDREDTLKCVKEFEEARKVGKDSAGLILVSTQVVEAGFDVSATKLWTQLAPWSSIVQRLGRLNRDGRSNDMAEAFIFEIPEDKKDPYASLPYEIDDIKTAKAIVEGLIKLSSEAPKNPIRNLLEKLKNGPIKEKVRKALEPKTQPYPRAVDVHGLFSTEPDVFGGFTDVSPWVRNADASADATVFWRNFDDKGKAIKQADGPGFQRKEGCPVAVYNLQKHLSGSKTAYLWNSKTAQWESVRPDDIRPGMTLLLSSQTGGYDADQGWTGQQGGNLGPLPPPGPFEESNEDDCETEIGEWVPLEKHLAETEDEAVFMAKGLALGESSPFRKCMIRSAALHDIGKSLKNWQGALLETHESERSTRSDTLWAKSPRSSKRFRPGLRHEVASALAMWHRYYRENIRDDFPALAIYLVAAHHGKARTALTARQQTQAPNVCGIPVLSEAPPISSLPWPSGWQMDLSAAEDGASGTFSEDGTEFVFESPGWTGLVADLLGGWEKDTPIRTCGAVPENEPAALGPFALAYLETLLRAADGRASQTPSASLKNAES